MRIAFDMDGVVTDLHTAYVQAALRLFPHLDRSAIATPEVGASPPDDAGMPETEVPDAGAELAVTRRQSEAIWRELAAQENFWEGLTEIEPGAVAKIAAVAEERRWDILFITSRPRSAGRTLQRQSQRWLEKMGFPLPSVFTVRGSRGKVAQALDLDVVIDDRPDNCLDVALESSAAAILLWRGNQDAVPASARRLGIAVAPNVTACLESLIEAEKSADGSLLDRLRKLFGLRTRSASTMLRRQSPPR
jgi:uncharacterized HAD superfamily protein